MTFKEACEIEPEYKTVLDRIMYLASLDRRLTEEEEQELTLLHEKDEGYRNKLNIKQSRY